jgi:hypothetical protein
MEAPSMIKIGKLHFLFLLVSFCAGFTLAQAQNITVSASLSETNIYSGEQVSLQLTISGSSMGSVQQPELPEIDGLRWLRGSTSRAQKYSLINGKPTVTYTHGFALVAQSPGNYTLPSIPVEIDDISYQTEPISFKVLSPGDANSGEAERSPDIFVRLEPSTSTPVVGQQVVTDIVLYFKNGIEVSSYQPTAGWKAEGFWKEELEYPQRAQTSSTIVNGVRYQQARLIQYALFPTKSGELTLSPFELTLSVRKQRSSSDPFGFGLGQERMNIESIPVTLDVQPLPELEDAIFIGAVGDFEISREISPRNAFVGETVEITTRITGSGNVPLVNKPEYNFPEELEKYNPQEASTIDRRNRKISGTRTFTDIVIARNEGQYSIPTARIAHFNPSTKRYEVTTLSALNFTAKRDPNATTISQNNLRFEIKPITGLAQWTTSSPTPLHEKAWVWVLIFFPLLLTGAAFGFKQYQDRMNTDTAFARSRTAADKASKTLETATKSTNVKEGYHLIEKATVQFITDKLNLPPAGLSHNHIIEEIGKLGDSAVTSEVKRLLSKCETIAYAPNATQETLESDVHKTKELIKKVGKLA